MRADRVLGIASVLFSAAVSADAVVYHRRLCMLCYSGAGSWCFASAVAASEMQYVPLNATPLPTSGMCAPDCGGYDNFFWDGACHLSVCLPVLCSGAVRAVH